MGDRNYHHTNQYNSFTAQSYSYSQSQPQNQPLSRLFDMRSSQGIGFSVNTSMPIYNSGAPYQTQNSNNFHDARSPPSWGDTREDLNKGFSPAWNYIDDKGGAKHHSPNRPFANLFDLPEQKGPDLKSSEWSDDNFSPSQSYQRNSQVGFNPHNNFSQQLPSTFSSDYDSQSNYRVSQSAVSLGKQSNDFKQNNNRGFGKQNKSMGRSNTGFRGHGKWQGRGSRHGHDRVGIQNNSNYLEGERNPENVKDFSDDCVKSGEMGEDVDYNDEYRGSEDEGNEGHGFGDHEHLEKFDVFIPCPDTIKKYEYYPPEPEKMGIMFKDLVIYFFFKIPKNRKEQNPFVVICESFRRSTGYDNLEVEDGYDANFKDRKFCTLRYKQMMMVRGVGENNCIKESRVRAGIELINKLAMSCYTLEAKPEYFNVGGFENMLQAGDVPGVYRIIPQEKAEDFDSARNLLKTDFLLEDSDVEYMFQLKNGVQATKLKNWANKFFKKLDARIIKDTWVGVCKHRTVQYWRDKILASGSMENAKFILKPPQGIGNLLIPHFNIQEAVVQLKKRPYPLNCTLENVYGPPGCCPNISTALPPWERRGGNFKNKKTRQKNRKIMADLAQGVPLTQCKSYKYLSQKKKKKLRQMLGQ